MKNLLITTMLFVLTSIEMFGQIYEAPQKMIEQFSLKVYCCGMYKIGADGFYHYEQYEEPLFPMDEFYYTSISKGAERFFCYVQKENCFYFHTDNFVGYYYPRNASSAKYLIKELKKSKVEKIKNEDVQTMLSEVARGMGNIYIKKNDSIAEAKKAEREKLVKDSIEAAKKKAQEMDEYRRTHDWRNFDIPQGVWCTECSKLYNKTTLRVISISADSLYYILPKPDITMLGHSYYKIHFCGLTYSLKNDIKFKEYVNIWRDSIANNNRFSSSDANLINSIQYNKFKDNICKEAPNGFIDSWGWNLNTAEGIEPNFTYFNTSKKTIKYVDFYFSVYNAVGDRCYLKYEKSYIGSVRGVGPIESFDYGSWEWDRATHYTSADATEMRIIKLVITYMDGTSKTIPEKLIKYN